jgi:hypothetical protein
MLSVNVEEKSATISFQVLATKFAAFLPKVIYSISSPESFTYSDTFLKTFIL